MTANTLFDFDLRFVEGTGAARMFVEWSSPSDSTQRRVPDLAFWSTQRIQGVTDIVIAAASTPADSTLESSPAGGSIVVYNTATYTMQSRSASNTAQPTEDDVYTVKLTCNDALCGNTEYTTTATHTTGGLYSADLTPSVGGTYDVLITMENAYTAAEPSVSTIISDDLTLVVTNPATVPNSSDDSLSLTVIDDTTVPSACTVVASDTAGDIVRPTGSTFTYTMQSKSSDGRDQAVTDDRYTVTLTSITAEE